MRIEMMVKKKGINMNKIMKYQILKPTNISWEDFGNILYNLRSEVRKIKNRTIALYHEWTNYTLECHDKAGEWPKPKDVYNYGTMSGYIYDRLKGEVRYSNSVNFNSSVRDAMSKYDTHKKDILAGKASVPNMGDGQPIDIYNKNIVLHHLDNEKKDYAATLSLLNNGAKAELGLLSGRVDVILTIKNETQTAILDRCLSGEYRVCGSQLVYEAAGKEKKGKKDKPKVWLYLCYGFEPEAPELDDSRIMGIDLGMKLPAVMAFNFNDKKYEVIDDNRILDRKIRLDKMLSTSKHQCQWWCNGNSGHGRKKKVDVYERYSHKSHNLSMDINHQWSKYIVDTAVKNKCGVIQMEDLSGIKASRQNFLGNWTYYDLQQKITYKAEEKGIKVIKVDPRYTSQMCPVCGYINKRNRSTQADFECLECGHIANADYNAARNIATPDIANIIKNRLAQQKKEGKPIE